MNNNKFNIGDRVELLSVDQYDTAYKLKTGDIGIITYLGYTGICRVDFPNKLNRVVYYDQIKLVEKSMKTPQSKEKYVKCIDNKEYALGILELQNLYKVTSESNMCYKLEINSPNKWWNKERFEKIEIPNPQNPVKSSVSEPQKSNKMELLMPILDIIERLQELEIDKDNVEDIIARIEYEDASEDEIKLLKNKIKELDDENSELKAKIYSMNFDMCDILTIVDKYKEMK